MCLVKEVCAGLPHPSRFSKGEDFPKVTALRPLSLEFLSVLPRLRDETPSKLLAPREAVHRYPQRGYSHRQYRRVPILFAVREKSRTVNDRGIPPFKKTHGPPARRPDVSYMW